MPLVRRGLALTCLADLAGVATSDLNKRRGNEGFILEAVHGRR
jgi:hypothetical protein